MKIIKIAILTFFLCSNLYCQLSVEWSKVYEEQNFFNTFKRMIVEDDSIFVVTNTITEMEIELLDSDGNLLFDTKISPSEIDSLENISNLIIPFEKEQKFSIIIQSNSLEDSEIVSLNYNSDGELENIFFEEEPFFFFVIHQFERDEMGNIYIATNDNWPNLAVSKFDKNLNYLWTNSFAAEGEITDDVQVSRLVVDELQNSYLAFDTEIANDRQIALSKFNEEGEQLWTYQYNHFESTGVHFERVINTELDSIGNPIISMDVKVGDQTELVVMKLHFETGEPIWIYESNPSENNSHSIYQTTLDSKGELVYAYRKESLDIQTNHIALINQEGILEWETQIYPNSTYPNFIFNELNFFNLNYCKGKANCRNVYFDFDQEDNIYIAGYASNNEVGIIELNVLGEFVSYEIFTVPNTTTYENREIYIDKSNRIYLFGFDADAESVHLTQLRQEWETGIDVPRSTALSLSPNPFTHELHLQSTTPIKTLHIYNTTGQLIHSESNVSGSDWSMNTARWQAGIYFVVVELEDGSVLREKVVKI